jgi:hypothetical protein
MSHCSATQNLQPLTLLFWKLEVTQKRLTFVQSSSNEGQEHITVTRLENVVADRLYHQEVTTHAQAHGKMHITRTDTPSERSLKHFQKGDSNQEKHDKHPEANKHGIFHDAQILL